MTRSELIDALVTKFPGLRVTDVTAAVKMILTAMAEVLEEGGRTEVRGFGSFSTVVRPSRIGRNPKTGISVPVPAKRAVYFKPGLELRERVDRPPLPGGARPARDRLVLAGGSEPQLMDIPRRKSEPGV